MNTRKIGLFCGQLITGAVLSFTLASCSASYVSSASQQNGGTVEQELNNQPVTVHFESSYVFFTHDEMIEKADIIFAGKVIEISPTHWNQDSGEYWEEVIKDKDGLDTTLSAWPVHEVKFSITQPIAGEIGKDEEVILTILGKSPTDDMVNTNTDGETIQLGNEPTYALQIGNEVVVYAIRGEITWLDPNQPARFVDISDGYYIDVGKRTIFDFMGMPGNSYLLKGDDGLYHSPEDATEKQETISLDILIAEIVQKRSTINQPASQP